MSGHTSGPWTVVEYGDGDNLAIHDGDSANRICFMATHGGSQKQWEAIQANAALIASAPALLEALQAMLEIAETWAVVTDRKYVQPENSETVAKARAAIALATHNPMVKTP